MNIQLLRTRCSTALAAPLASFLFLVAVPAFGQDSEVVIILDNLVNSQTAYTSVKGTWWPSSGENPYGEDSLYNKDRDGLFTWHVYLPRKGEYDVYAWWTYWPTRSSNVPIRIDDAGRINEILVNMADPTLSGQWNFLGSFDLDGLINIQVSGENGQANADAIKLVPKGLEPEGQILGFYSATQDSKSIPAGQFGFVKSPCGPGDYAVSGSYAIGGVSSSPGFRISSFTIVIDGSTGIQSWVLQGVNESTQEVKIGVWARCADVAE